MIARRKQQLKLHATHECENSSNSLRMKFIVQLKEENMNSLNYNRKDTQTININESELEKALFSVIY